MHERRPAPHLQVNFRNSASTENPMDGRNEDPPATEGAGGAIRFAGTLDLPLYRMAYWLAQWGTPMPWPPILITGLLLAVGVGLFSTEKAGAGAVYTGAGVLVGASLLLQEASIRKTWKSHRLARDATSGWLDEDGFHAHSELGEGAIPWNRFYQVKAAATLMLLYQSAVLYLILGEEHFATREDWKAAKALVLSMVPAAPKVKVSRVIWLILLFTAVLFGLLVLWGWWQVG